VGAYFKQVAELEELNPTFKHFLNNILFNHKKILKMFSIYLRLVKLKERKEVLITRIRSFDERASFHANENWLRTKKSLIEMYNIRK
jgi:hypothetical protein